MAQLAATATAQRPIDHAVSYKATITGLVRDAEGLPIEGATVLVLGANLSTSTDSAGRFKLGGVNSGQLELDIRKLGFEPYRFKSPLVVDTALFVSVRMLRVRTLETVEVQAERLSVRIRSTGFPSRQRLGIGKFVTPERIDSMRHVSTASQFLRDVSGLEVRCGSANVCDVRPRLPPYCLHIFVDGGLRKGKLDDWVSVGEVYAIEVYDRPSRVPAEFQGQLPQKTGRYTVKAGCGAIVVWTRSRAGVY